MKKREIIIDYYIIKFSKLLELYDKKDIKEIIGDRIYRYIYKNSQLQYSSINELYERYYDDDQGLRGYLDFYFKHMGLIKIMDKIYVYDEKSERVKMNNKKSEITNMIELPDKFNKKILNILKNVLLNSGKI